MHIRDWKTHTGKSKDKVLGVSKEGGIKDDEKS